MQYHNPNEGRSYGIGGLVLGIIGILTACVSVGLLFGLIGLILSIIGLIKANKANARKQLIIAALVVSIIATLFGSIALGYYIKNSDSMFNTNNNNIFDQNERFDRINENFDSLELDEEDFNNLDKSMEDQKNGPGSAPEE